jgi:hypothetical protein
LRGSWLPARGAANVAKDVHDFKVYGNGNFHDVVSTFEGAFEEDSIPGRLTLDILLQVELLVELEYLHLIIFHLLLYFLQEIDDDIMSDCNRINGCFRYFGSAKITTFMGCSTNDGIPDIVTGRSVDHEIPLLEARKNNCSRGKQPMDLPINFEPLVPSSLVQVAVPLSELSGRDWLAEDPINVVQDRLVAVQDRLDLPGPEPLRSEAMMTDQATWISTSVPGGLATLQSLFGGHFIDNHGSFNISVNYYQLGR